MKTPLALTDFLNLSIGSATDAYLRELALIAIQSRQLTHTVEQLSIYQRSLTGAETPKAEAPKGKLIDGRYFVANDGTVIDRQTKLMWMQSPLEETFTFYSAYNAVRNLNAKNGFAGYCDWRVPSQEELLSLVVKGQSPSICQEAFPDTPAWFWTSTPHADNLHEAWMVNFSNGLTYDISRFYLYFIRLVR